MPYARAHLQNHHQTPRKMRAVADLIRGKTVAEALALLGGVSRAAAKPLVKLLRSAVANATENDGLAEEFLRISRIEVNKGIVMKRMMPRARGSGAPIRKRLSHVTIVLRSPEKAIIQKANIKNQNDRSKS